MIVGATEFVQRRIVVTRLGSSVEKDALNRLTLIGTFNPDSIVIEVVTICGDSAFSKPDLSCAAIATPLCRGMIITSSPTREGSNIYIPVNSVEMIKN